MSQHDMDLANAAGATFRADLNLALVALASQNSGATAPATTFAYMVWADTANDRLKIRNAANNAWIEVLVLSTGAPVSGAAAAIQAQTYTAYDSAGTAPAFTVTTSPAYGALAAEQRMRVAFHAAGTTGSNTLNRDGLGAKNLKQYDLTGVKAPAIVAANQLADIEYDGTDMVILNPLPLSASTAEAQAGTDNTKALTALRLRDGLNASGSAPVYGCRAWVNFNGTGTVAIRASGNVSSITDNGTGDYTINFTTALPDADYAVVGTASQSSGAGSPNYVVGIKNAATYSTTQLRITTGTPGSSVNDADYVSVAVFR